MALNLITLIARTVENMNQRNQMSKKEQKKTTIPEGNYTIYWQEETQYDVGFYTPGCVNNVRGYQFTGTRLDVALHIKYYLKRKTNLVKVEVTPFKGNVPDSDVTHWHLEAGEAQLHSWETCPDNPNYIRIKNGKEKESK